MVHETVSQDCEDGLATGQPRILRSRRILTLTLHTCVEEKRVRVRQMWPRAGSGMSKRT